MKFMTKNRNVVLQLNSIVEWIIHIIVYALILSLVSIFFKTIDIDNTYYGIYALFASLIIYLLNKTIKPILFRLTVPITGITMGLFYPCLNILILKLTDFILGSHFETHGIITLFLTAILISAMNLLMEEVVLKPILRKGDRNERGGI